MNKKGLIIAGIVAVLAIAGGTTCYFMFNKPVTTGTETTTTSTGEVNTSTTQTGEEIVNLEMPNVEYKTNDVETPFAIGICNKYYAVKQDDSMVPLDASVNIEFIIEKDIIMSYNSTFTKMGLPVQVSETVSKLVDANHNVGMSTSLTKLSVLGNNYIGYKDNNTIAIVNDEGTILKEYANYTRFENVGEGYIFLRNNYKDGIPGIILDKDGNEVLRIDLSNKFTNVSVQSGILLIGKDKLIDLTNKEQVSFINGDWLGVSSVSEDRSIIVFKASGEDYDKAVMINKNFYELPTTCKKVTLKNNIAFCNNYESAYKLTDSGLEYLDLTNKVLFDENNYAIETNGNVEIYENGNKTVTLENKHLVSNNKYMANKVVLVKDNDYNYSYYYINGKRITTNTYKEADSFNEYGLAIVRESGNYEIINIKGETLTKEYQNITFKDNYYLAKNNDNTFDVINLKGEVVTTINNDRTKFITRNDDRHFLVVINSDTKSVIDFDKKTTIIENAESLDSKQIHFHNNFILIEKDNKGNLSYYTYNGTKLSEENVYACQQK